MSSSSILLHRGSDLDTMYDLRVRYGCDYCPLSTDHDLGLLVFLLGFFVPSWLGGTVVVGCFRNNVI